MVLKTSIVFMVAALAVCFAGCASTDAAKDRSLKVGSFAPDFTLEDAHGGMVTLSQMTAHGSVLIIFYLGYDCPHCVRHLRELANRQADVKNVGGQIVAISPDAVGDTKQSIQEFGDFPFPLLADPDKKVANAFGLVHGNGVMFHGAVIIDRRGQIRFLVRSDHPYDNIDELIKRLGATLLTL